MSQELRGEVFGQGTWKVSDRMAARGRRPRGIFDGSAKAEPTGKAVPSSIPSRALVLTWSPDSGTQVRAALRKGRRPARLQQFRRLRQACHRRASRSATRTSRPTSTRSTNCRSSATSGTRARSCCTLMHEDIKDVVDFVPIRDSLGNLFDAPGNIGNGQNNQITFQVTLPLDKLFIPERPAEHDQHLRPDVGARSRHRRRTASSRCNARRTSM